MSPYFPSEPPPELTVTPPYWCYNCSAWFVAFGEREHEPCCRPDVGYEPGQCDHVLEHEVTCRLREDLVEPDSPFMAYPSRGCVQ